MKKTAENRWIQWALAAVVGSLALQLCAAGKKSANNSAADRATPAAPEPSQIGGGGAEPPGLTPAPSGTPRLLGPPPVAPALPGLSIAGPIQPGGSDAQSAAFQQNVLPSLTQLLNQPLGGGAPPGSGLTQIDPTQIQLATDYQVRAYFVGEHTARRSAVGMNPTGRGIASGDPTLLFPNASSNPSGRRTFNAPLQPGDFVDAGTVQAGQTLDFFLISDMWKKGIRSDYVFSSDPAANADGINHVSAFVVQDSPYLLISFEDAYGGGDGDMNDVLVALDVGGVNARSLAAAPEPGLWLTLASFVGAVCLLKRRRAGNVGASLP